MTKSKFQINPNKQIPNKANSDLGFGIWKSRLPGFYKNCQVSANGGQVFDFWDLLFDI